MNPNESLKWKNCWDNPKSHLVLDYDLMHDITILKRSEILSIFQDQADFLDLKNKRFIDLGAGKGAASFSILEKHNDAKALLIDGSIPMLDDAKKMAKNKGYNIETIYQDLSDSKWISKINVTEKYPLIISSIMIHHLTDYQKARFFKDICSLLLPNGKFLYADVIKMENEEQENIANELWISEIIKNKKKYNVEPKSFKEEKDWLFNEIERQGDMPAKITFILNSLQEAGFKEGTMIWFYIKFAVFLAKK